MKTLQTGIGISILLFLLFRSCVFLGSHNNKPAEVMSDQQKLEETCKDWIFNRNQIIKYTREGNPQKAERARMALRAFDADLKQWPANKVADTINALQQNGYKTGLE